MGRRSRLESSLLKSAHRVVAYGPVSKAFLALRVRSASTRSSTVSSSRRGAGGWWFATEVEIEFDSRAATQIYRPDVSGWRRDRLPELPEEVPVTARPDWICEVLSRSNKRNDTIRKRRVYHRSGVGHYWILDPDEATLEVFRWHMDGYLLMLTAERGDHVRAEPFDALELD
ncbi:MAG: Uma2 family endonuclease [Labilithrix sp.]|nr:Uma2 family endonuclease [Labilithrix sp.]MCW5812252.1 Uma2 family endonuclease [Labilithrix sp.]